MADVKIKIDDQEVIVPAGSTILDAAKKLQIPIPTLCHMNLHEAKMNNRPASCRVCLVEVVGRRNLVPACVDEVSEGMCVYTHTRRVLDARKMVVELLLSDHPQDCLTCTKSGNCDLQDLAQTLGIRKKIQGERKQYAIDCGTSIVRDINKCIMCRRCETMCNEVQTVGALSGSSRGFEARVITAFEHPLDETVCVQCGQCVAVCPTGALTEREYIDDVIDALSDPNKKVIVQVAPAVRSALGEEFGLEPGTLVTGKMVAALKQIGFDYVFDTNFGADVTIMEEGYELVDRLTKFINGESSSRLPILTSCCPGWVNFFESQYSDLLELPSTARSPQQIFGAIAKSYFAEKMQISRENMYVVSVMPCLAKKFEAKRPEFNNDVDVSISTRELARLIKQFNINFDVLSEMPFDQPLGSGTGAAAIFGTTGGVMEAALRTAYEVVTGETLEKVVFTEVRGLEGIREAIIPLKDLQLHVGIVHGLGNARKIMDEIRAGNPRGFHAIEVMACPGGCIGGAGQPYHHGNGEVLRKRQNALYTIDELEAIRKSHENQDVIKLYKEYLEAPLSEKAHHLLHTHYNARITK